MKTQHHRRSVHTKSSLPHFATRGKTIAITIVTLLVLVVITLLVTLR
ncbi:MAG: hypothetical protein AABX37_05305 [Nanoarchaeota archaeon]